MNDVNGQLKPLVRFAPRPPANHPPKRPVDIERHHVEPEEANHEEEVQRVAGHDAGGGFGREQPHLDQGEGRVADGQPQDVAHQGLAVHVPQLRNARVHEQRDEQKRHRQQHSCKKRSKKTR